MPYVPSLKTDGKSDDRMVLDAAVEIEAKRIAENTPRNFSVLLQYKILFQQLGESLLQLESSTHNALVEDSIPLAVAIYATGKKYGYEGAFLGELNYAVTRLIQRVPQIKVELGHWVESSELRYWLYAVTTEALVSTATLFIDSGVGVGGVFEDIKDEYKRRVNVGYEAAQIIKSGDCYDTPWYTRLIEVVDSEDGHLIGHQEVMLKRSPETINQDVLEYQLVVRKKATVESL